MGTGIDRGIAIGAGLLMTAAGLTLLQRPAPLLGAVLLVLSVGALVRTPGGRPSEGRASDTALAMLVGAAPVAVLVGVIHDRLPFVPPAPLSLLGIGLLWTVTARTFGSTVAGRVGTRPGARRDAWMLIAGVGGMTAVMAGAMLRHLLPSASAATRMTWILGEEDNAHVVGVAREVLAAGPRGEQLAEQYGTAFMNIPVMVLRLLGGPLASDGDVRLQAVTAFTVSTLFIVLLAGLALQLLVALPPHVHPSVRTARPSATNAGTGAVAAAAATAVVMALLVVLPMRTGFLTFVWGLTLVLLAAGVVAVLPADATITARSVVVVHLLGTVLLLLSSWPFILPALAPLLLLPLLWVRWDAVRRVIRARPARSVAVAGVALAVIVAGGLSFVRWGPMAEVLSYGLALFTIGGSAIAANGTAAPIATASLLGATLLALGLTRGGARSTLLLAVVGPVVGAGALLLGLELAADLLTGGELNYAGTKLRYGIVTLALALGLTTLVAQAGRLGSIASAATLALVATLHMTSPTAALWTDWWARTDLGEGPHAIATVDAIRRTSDDLPMRCLPSPSTRVTPGSRQAIYFCARWLEDAFNPGRFQGYRDELRDTGEETFGPIIEQVTAQSPNEYLFAYPFRLGPGWFGWAGDGT